MVDDGGGSSTIGTAIDWLQNALTGSIATSIAIIAIAAIGFLMLSGRVDVRGAVRVVIGCFIIFGASLIATGIRDALVGGVPNDGADYAAVPQPYYPPASPGNPGSADEAYDPYAGAALPSRE